MSKAPRSFDCALVNEWTRKPPGKHSTFKRIDGHELIALPHLFGYTRVPVLDPDEHTFAVIVSRVADVERPARIPKRRPGSSTDVTSCELARNLFDDVFQGVVGKVACEVTQLDNDE
jgi:hypothetical protein